MRSLDGSKGRWRNESLLSLGKGWELVRGEGIGVK